MRPLGLRPADAQGEGGRHLELSVESEGREQSKTGVETEDPSHRMVDEYGDALVTRRYAIEASDSEQDMLSRRDAGQLIDRSHHSVGGFPLLCVTQAIGNEPVACFAHPLHAQGRLLCAGTAPNDC